MAGAAPPPPPTANVWQERREFYADAAPVTADEADEMLAAALKLSILQAEEDQLRRQM